MFVWVFVSGNDCNEQKNIVTFSVFLPGNIPKHSENDFTKTVHVYKSTSHTHMIDKSLFQESVKQ